MRCSGRRRNHIRKWVSVLNEKCLECKHCEIIEDGCKGFLGETILLCEICEEETENKDLCFEPKYTN